MIHKSDTLRGAALRPLPSPAGNLPNTLSGPLAIEPDDPVRSPVLRPARRFTAGLANAGVDLPEPTTTTTPVRLLERTAGRSLTVLAREQLDWMQRSAAADNKSVGAFVRGEVSRRGYGGNEATWWPALTDRERAAWTERFEAAVAVIKEVAPAELKEQIRAAEAAGGGIEFHPARCEEMNAYAFRRKNILGVGKSWLLHVERDPTIVFANIAHELGGHLEYGDTSSWKVFQRVLELMPEAERELAKSGKNSLYSSYAYMETEMYAELREHAFRVPHSGGDSPRNDVPNQLAKLKGAFAPSVADALVRTFRARVAADPKITPEALALLDEAIQTVFDMSLRPAA